MNTDLVSQNQDYLPPRYNTRRGLQLSYTVKEKPELGVQTMVFNTSSEKIALENWDREVLRQAANGLTLIPE